MGVLVYNGLRSIDYQVVVEHPPVFSMPERDYEKVHVPGRNGDVIIDNGSYQNTTAKYEICFGSYTKYFPEMVYQVSKWLHSAQGQYARLEDSYDPDHFRLAAYLEENEFENIMFHAGRTTVEFDCKPQRFLKSGEKPLLYKNVNEIRISNPTIHDSLPFIQIEIHRLEEDPQDPYPLKLVIDGEEIAIAIPTSVWDAGEDQKADFIQVGIDSDLQEVYGVQSSGAVFNLNPVSIFVSGVFPKLVPGLNTMTVSLDQVEEKAELGTISITPNWWTL